MKVLLNGSTHWAAQVPRIADGFRQLGHEVTDLIGEADLVYSQNSHTQILKDKAAGILKPGAKVILTCLDVPTHLGCDCPFDQMKAELSAADAVCTISQFGQWQVRNYFDLDSMVIWNPVKPVSRQPELAYRPFSRFLHVGRRQDFNKRFHLAVNALRGLSYAERDLVTVGNEQLWGDHLSVLTDAELNRVYNSVDFVFTCGFIEGLSLPTLEAMAVGAVPVVCSDMTTRRELLPSNLFPEYDEIDATPTAIACFIKRLTDRPATLVGLKERLYCHFQREWSYRTSTEGVAQAILTVYTSLLEPDRVHV